jgi:hypothetical protein
MKRYVMAGLALLLLGGAPFFLSCRKAGELLDVPHHEANRWLRGLVLDGLLSEAEKGVAGGKRATRYRYVGKSLRPDVGPKEQ